MITVSNTYRTNADNKPLEYLIQISEDGGTTWQDIPTGAQVVDRPGDLTNEVEANMPFNFVGPDCELVCENINGYWTNDSATGKLDTGAQVQLLLQSRPAGATDYIKHIQGPIDLSSLRKLDRPFISFIVRGTLNMLDDIFANYVLADRPATYPHKMKGWLKILSVSPGHPIGLYELKYNGKDKTLSWDGGQAGDINTDDDIELAGQDGNVITVRNLRNTTECLAIPSDDDISQWIAIKDISGTIGVYQPYPALSMSNLKSKLSSTIDLDIANVEFFNVAGNDKNILNYLPDDIGVYANGINSLGISHIVSTKDYYSVPFGVDLCEFLVSSPAGPFKGLWMLTLKLLNGGYMEVLSFSRNTDILPNDSTSTVVNSCKVGNYLYLLWEDSASPQHTYLNTINSWGITKYNCVTLSPNKSLTGTGSLFFRSFACYSEDNLYGCIVTTGDNAKVNLLDISGGSMVITPKTGTAFDTGVSMVPAVIGLGQFYIACTAALDAAKVKTIVYLQIHDIVNVANYTITTSIEKDNSDLKYEKYGPCMMSRRNIVVDYQQMRLETLGFYLLMAPMFCNSAVKKQLGCADTDLYDVVINDNVAPLIKGVGMVKDKVSGAFIKDKFCTNFFAPNIVGLTLEWTSGSNIGETKAITAADIVMGVSTMTQTKITVASDFTNVIEIGDKFKVYKGTFDLTGAGYTYKLTDKKGINFLRSPEQDSDWEAYPGLAADNNSYYSVGDKIKAIAKNVDHGYIVAGEFSQSRKVILLATADMLILAGANTVERHTPQVYDADFGTKTLREAIEEIAISANCRIAASEHYQKISLLYKGLTPAVTFGLTPNDYVFDHNYQPFYNYKAVKVNDAQYGRIHNNKYDYILSLSCDLLPDCLSTSVAKDILTHIGAGDRLHSIKTTWKVWLEPGDCGYLQTPEGGTTKVLVISANTDFTNRIHQLTVLEVAEWGNQ